MNWNWDPGNWKKSTKVLLGLVTVWPIIYMGLFFIGILSAFLLIPFADDRSGRNSETIDLIQLERKIVNSEIKELTLRPYEIVAKDSVGNREYRTEVSNESSRAEILRQAREIGANGQPRVARIEEEPARPPSPVFPIGVVMLFGAHFLTIVLIMLLMPLYIILAVKNDRLDQTTRIVWVVLTCTVGMFADPVYWYLYIWRAAPVHPAAPAPLSEDKSASTH